MIKREIRKAKSYPTKKGLFQSLRGSSSIRRVNRILDYLEGSNQILLDKGGIVWTFPSNPRMRRLHRIQCMASLVRLVRPRRRVIGNSSRVGKSGETFLAVHDLRYRKGRGEGWTLRCRTRHRRRY